MTRSKYCCVLVVLFALAAVLPVNAAQMKAQNAKADEAEQTEASEVTESVSEYVRLRTQEMKGLRAVAKEEAQTAVMERVQERVEAMIQNAIRRYEKVQTQIRNAEGLTEVEKAELGAKVGAQIQAMNELRTQVQSATSVAELKQAMSQVKSRFKFSLGLVHQSINGVFEDRLGVALTNITEVYVRLESKVTALEDGDLKDDLGALLAEAQAYLVDAKAQIDAGELVTAKEDLIKARNLLSEVAESL